MEQKYLSIKEAATMTGLSVSTLYRWVLQRIHIPFIKAGGRVLYDPADIETFMDSNKVKMQTQKQ